MKSKMDARQLGMTSRAVEPGETREICRGQALLLPGVNGIACHDTRRATVISHICRCKDQRVWPVNGMPVHGRHGDLIVANLDLGIGHLGLTPIATRSPPEPFDQEYVLR